MNGNGGTRRRWLYLLLLAPLVGLMYVPFYDGEKPELFGFPFFYWYQFAWVIGAALITWIVYVGTRPPREARGERRFDAHGGELR